MNFKTIGHRGNPSEKPENTMASFLSAYECGADAIETDIQITKDGKIVIFHDDSMERLTGKKCSVHDLNLREIKELRILDTDQHVPDLEEFMDQFRGKEMFIELKARNERGDRINPGLERALHEFFKNDYSPEIHFISFDIEAIRTMKSYDKNYSVGLDIAKETQFIWESMMNDHIPDFMDYVIPEFSIVSEEKNDIKEYGEKIIPWVLNDPKDLSILEKKGINKFMTDRPCFMKNHIK